MTKNNLNEGNQTAFKKAKDWGVYVKDPVLYKRHRNTFMAYKILLIFYSLALILFIVFIMGRG